MGFPCGPRLFYCGVLEAHPSTIVYLYTTFPKGTETFMQREIIAMRAHGVRLRLY